MDVVGSGFADGATVDFGNRIAVQSVNVVDGGLIEVRIRVHNRASPGPRDVTVTNPDDTQDTNVGCFNVN